VTAPTIRAELAAAIRAVNSRFNTLPKSAQDSIEIERPDLDAELDRALLADDRVRALNAIESWRDHHLALIASAGK
jgi:hypothetical protein